jgi:hypothetical protein
MRGRPVMATVRKRTRHAADGTDKTSWVADYFDQHRKRHLKTFKTQKAAKAWLIETQGEVARGAHTPERQSRNVHEAAQLWLAHCKAEGRERSTLRSYEGIVRRHIEPGLGAVKLAQLTKPVLEGWRDRLVLKLSRPRARTTLTVLKMILKDAERRGLIGHNPASPITIASKTRDVRKLVVGVDVPGKAQIQKLLTTLGEPRWVRYRPRCSSPRSSPGCAPANCAA